LSITIGRIEGIKIEINYSLLLAFALITWSLASGFLPIEYPGHGPLFNWGIGALSAIALFISILLHELSHSTVALRQGLEIKSITLFFFGGVSQIEENTKSPSNELKMAIAGPLMSLLIGAILYIIYYLLGSFGPAAVRALLQYVGLVNMLLGFFNLVPAFPMDGGRVLRSIFWSSKNDIISATRTATKVSHIISYIFIGLGFISMFISLISGVWLIFLGIFINRGAEAELKQSIAQKKLEGTKLRDIMKTDFKTLS
jgi:Zn-dependent protease